MDSMAKRSDKDNFSEKEKSPGIPIIKEKTNESESSFESR